MSWILFSILAALVWAIVNTVDKYIFTKWIRKPVIPLMILGIIGLIASFFVYLFHGFSYLSYFNIVLAFVTGILYILSMLFYFKAVKIEEISRVVPLFYLTSLFVSILAAVFLGEIFTPVKYLGIFLLIIGAILVSSKNFIKFGFGKAFWLMIAASLVLSVNVIITKYLLDFADFLTIFSYIRIGAFFALIPIFCFSFKDLISTVREHGKKVIIVISLNEILNLVGVLLITIAMTKGYVTLVNALSSVQPLFVLLFAVILSVFYPKILKEEIDKKTVLIK
ncbi:EamA family transporter, partial [Candidatus Woesearchaeota archaeon]|nr:EamA family transporter [Candidatus Woesearchaeota archaeon]